MPFSGQGRGRGVLTEIFIFQYIFPSHLFISNDQSQTTKCKQAYKAISTTIMKLPLLHHLYLCVTFQVQNIKLSLVQIYDFLKVFKPFLKQILNSFR